MTQDDTPDKAAVEATAYRLLARRDHARQELAQKLRQRQLPEDLIQEVLDECEQANYLNDERFARVQGRILARKEWGPRQIAHKLRQRGVHDKILTKVLDEIQEEVHFSRLARERLLRRFGPPEELDQAQRQRAYRHLLHRGFTPPTIRSLLFED